MASTRVSSSPPKERLSCSSRPSPQDEKHHHRDDVGHRQPQCALHGVVAPAGPPGHEQAAATAARRPPVRRWTATARRPPGPPAAPAAIHGYTKVRNSAASLLPLVAACVATTTIARKTTSNSSGEIGPPVALGVVEAVHEEQEARADEAPARAAALRPAVLVVLGLPHRVEEQPVQSPAARSASPNRAARPCRAVLYQVLNRRSRRPLDHTALGERRRQRRMLTDGVAWVGFAALIVSAPRSSCVCCNSS